MKILPWYVVYAAGFSAALGLAGHRSRPVSGGPSPRPRPKRILIVGGTGGTGRELLTQALERGYQVTALVRDPSRIAKGTAGLTVVQGDVMDSESVRRTMAGQEAVVSVLGHRRYFGPTRILSEGTRNLLDAMQAHGVPRFVGCTSLGIGDSAGRLGLMYTLFVLPIVLPFYFWDKARQERIIASSNVEWTIVRPAALTNGERRGQVRHGHGVGHFLWTQSVSRADVAAFMLDQLESDQYLRSAAGVA
jgi:uncharacterized protein YbjT (DUF2867 family)